MEPRSKILVIRGGAIGDFILTLPVLQSLRGHYPGSRLEILGNPVAALAVAAGWADDLKLLGSAPFAGLFAEQGSCAPAIREWLASFDLIVSYLFDPDRIFRDNIGRYSSARFVVGPHRPGEASTLHAAEQLWQPLGELGIQKVEARPRLPLPSKLPQRRLAAHIGSGSERKNWPVAQWRGLFERLMAETDYELLVIGGEAEGNRVAQLTVNLPADRIIPAQNLPLIELAEKMQSCRAFIGHDSGITHLAAALDLPGVVLWGETVWTVWRPISERMTVVRDPRGLSQLEERAVWEALRKII